MCGRDVIRALDNGEYFTALMQIKTVAAGRF